MSDYKKPDEFAQLILDLLEQNEISDYVIMYRHPDRTANFRTWLGDPFWAEGAISSMARDIRLHNDVMISDD